jgi:anaerobic selenocysteine-containing dehydrogenase
VISIDGIPDNPVTDGYICGKVRRYADHVYGPERLRTPARRTGAKGAAQFAAISWDEALTEIVERIRQIKARFGAEAILPYCYGGSNGLLTQGTTDARFFRRLGASRLARTLCGVVAGRAAEGLYGRMAGVAFDDYVHSRLIVIWGANPNSSGIHLVPFIRRARKNGARLVVVDPRRTPLAKSADLHLRVRPGGDLALALGVIRQLFETGQADDSFLHAHAAEVPELRERAAPWTLDRAAEKSGVPTLQIERFVQMYAESSPAVIRCGWGLERNRNAGSSIAAVLALPAIAGKFGVRGGGYTMSNSAAWNLQAEAAARAAEPNTRLINMNQLGRTLLEEQSPPVKMLFVYNANPAVTVPDQQRVLAGLSREDLFTVVFEQVLTDTARYADIVLPATTFLEHTDYRRSYGSMYLFQSAPAIEPLGEARPNYEVFAELCDRLGLSKPGDPVGPESLIETILAASGNEQLAISLRERGFACPACGPNPVQFDDVFPNTPDRRVHLVPQALDAEAPNGLYRYCDPFFGSDSDSGANGRYPLSLLSPATSRTISSSLGQLIKSQIPIELNPDDAQRRGIADGDCVRVFNSLGEVRCRAIRNLDLSPGTAVLPKGLWSHNTLNGNTATSLAPDMLTDLAGGACFNDARVEIERFDEGAL